MTPLTVRVAALSTLIGDRWPTGTEARLVAELARTLPRSLAHMVASTPDGFPTSTPGANNRGQGGRSTAELTSVESAVARRDHAAASYGSLCGSVALAAVQVALEDRQALKSALRAAQRLVDEWQPPAVVTPTALRCAPCEVESLEPWTRPDCENNAVKAGLCSACYMRRRRWKAEQEQEVA